MWSQFSYINKKNWKKNVKNVKNIIWYTVYLHIIYKIICGPNVFRSTYREGGFWRQLLKFKCKPRICLSIPRKNICLIHFSNQKSSFNAKFFVQKWYKDFENELPTNKFHDCNSVTMINFKRACVIKF